MLSRRLFISQASGGALGLFVWSRAGGARLLAATLSGRTLQPGLIPKYRTPLLVPPAMPRAGRVHGGTVDYYEIAMRQIQQQVLPPGLPTTPVWAYGPRVASNGPAIFHAPSLTIEARHRTPVRVRWVNELVDAKGDFLPHLLAVDPTLHWANPAGGLAHRDSRPSFDDAPGRYRGPVPIVTHVHGAVGVGDESDGYAEAWFLPDARNIPEGYATEGTWYRFFAEKAATKGCLAPGSRGWERGSAVFEYPNTQRASTIWYHDHTLGMTRLNVYAGPAGFYLVRGGADDAAIDERTGARAILPGPAPGPADPAGTRHGEIPMAIQDRSFNPDGSLFYPASREVFDGIPGPYIPFSDIPPIWNPEFFGECLMVNGHTWPYLEVEQRRYRFRLLNGCNSRFLILDFRRIPGIEVWQIGNEGGFLAAPVNLSADHGGRLLMAPAERADLIVDFARVPRDAFVLGNVGPDEPFGGGDPDDDFEQANAATTGQVLQFRVVRATSADVSTPPEFLRLPDLDPLGAGRRRQVALLEATSALFEAAPIEARLGTVAFDRRTGAGTWTARPWHQPVTENPEVGATETWEIFNATADAHPIHVHDVFFQVVNRQAVLVDDERRTFEPVPGAEARAPEPWERGWKDTVTAYPGEVTRVRMRFGQAGRFVWHCHIVEHEDNEMMRPYRIGRPQAGEPDGMREDGPAAGEPDDRRLESEG